MLKLTKSRESFWLDGSKIGEGVRFHLLPVTPAMIVAARAAGSSAVLKSVTENPGAGDQATGKGEAAFTRMIVQAGLKEVEGIGDQDGNPITELTPEIIDALLLEWPIFDFLDKRYVNPSLTMEQEKNGSSPLENGTSGAKTPAPAIAQTAPIDAQNAPIE